MKYTLNVSLIYCGEPAISCMCGITCLHSTLTFYASQTYNEPLDVKTGKILKAIKTTFEEIASQNLMYRVSQIKRHPGLYITTCSGWERGRCETNNSHRINMSCLRLLQAAS